jgi:hypothetical protein
MRDTIDLRTESETIDIDRSGMDGTGVVPLAAASCEGVERAPFCAAFWVAVCGVAVLVDDMELVWAVLEDLAPSDDNDNGKRLILPVMSTLS